jgi:putative ABC transport system permease protein
MHWLRSFLSRDRREREFERELQFHIDEVTRENMAHGMPHEEAYRQAMLEFGGKEQATQELRDVYAAALLERFLANLKAGLRLVRRAPGFSAAVILTLALGIGANSAVFSAINAVLLRPLPFPDGDELMLLKQINTRRKEPVSFVAPLRLEDWNRLNSTFQAITGYYTENDSETSGELPEKVTHAFVAPRFLQVWGIAPALGRDFTPEEEKFGGPNAVLISDGFWRRRFHADTGAVGKSVRFGSYSLTVVGVMPPSFLFPAHDAELWTPVPIDSPYAGNRQSTWYTVVGRSKPGVSLAQARANIASVQNQIGNQFPKTDSDIAVEILPLKENTVGGVRRSLWMLFGSVTLLLMIACTNIAALLLARTTEREYEISVRFSLGASRRALLSQLLTETLVLALAGSGLGLLLATSAARMFQELAGNLPRVQEITLDWRLAAYTLVCGLAVTFLCGLLPALHATRGLAGSLARSSHHTQVSAHNPLQWVLVGVQVALAVTLLFGAGLLLRSFQELGRVSPGFDPGHVLTLHISASWGETADMKALTQRINRILDTLRSVPGVESAATASTLPGVPNQFQTELKIAEGQQDPYHKVIADSRFVSPGYFSVMRIPMLSGAPCEDSSNDPSIVVNRDFADRYFANEPAAGHHLVVGGPGFPLTGQVRGIAAAAREQGLSTEPMPTVYWCFSAPVPDPYYLIRTHGEPMALVNSVRRAIHQVEPGRSVFDVMPLVAHLRDAFAEDRMRTILLTLFAMTAVSLACVGLYGTLSYVVMVRHREIGLRLAVGATRAQITLRYLVQGLRVTLIGCACGLILAAVSARLLAGMPFGVSSFDAMTFSGVIVIVLIVAGSASLIPALRASRTDPMQVLREQ